MDLDRQQRADIRIAFFRAFKVASVSVRRDEQAGEWYLDVGVTEPVALVAEGLPAVFESVPVRLRQVEALGHAVQYR